MADHNGICTKEQISAVLTRLAEIRRKIAAACEAVDPVLINAAVDEGVTLLGENRVQEFLSKRDAYRPQAEVQFIGHLQTNKVKQIIDKVTLIHSVDSLHLAEAISRAAEAKGIVMPVLLEVNIGGELSKSGELPHVHVCGLMTIPPPAADETEQNAVFARMKQLYDRLSQEAPMHVLSMGMSGDYEAAVRNGATVVRIGSALFGPRMYPQTAV